MSQSSFECDDAAEGLKVSVFLSRADVARLSDGRELLLRGSDEDDEASRDGADVVEVKVFPSPE